MIQVRQLTGSRSDNPFASHFGANNRSEETKAQQAKNAEQWDTAHGFAPKPASGTAGAPMELKTTRAADGSMTTSVPGAPSGGFGDPSELFQALIRHRLQNPTRQSPVLAAQPPAQVYKGASQSRSSAPEYVPQLGSDAPVKPQRVTRERRIRNTMSQPSWAGSAGNEWTTTSEYQLPDGSWSLDAVYGPITQTGGR